MQMSDTVIHIIYYKKLGVRKQWRQKELINMANEKTVLKKRNMHRFVPKKVYTF